MTDAAGVNVDEFWSQWIDKPGHPILEYSWTYEPGTLKIKVDQKQNTSSGIPIYKIPTKVGVISAGGLNRFPVVLDGASQVISIPLSKEPASVILDPDHDLLKEARFTWKREELLPIVLMAPCTVDKNEALRRLLRDNPTDTELEMITKMIADEPQMFPSIRSINGFVSLEKESLRGFFMKMATHKNLQFQADAINALGRLPKTDAAVKLLQSKITATDGIQVVVNSLRILSEWDAKGNKALFEKAAKIPSRNDRIKRAATSALEAAK
jgi:aminopeptidase N